MGRITSQLPNWSPSATVGSLGATELLLTTLSPSRSGRLIETAAESDVAGAILASISLVGTELELLANLAGVLFFGYAVYEFLPRLFPEELAVVTNRRGYRIFAACFAVVASETIATALLSDGGVSSGVVWGSLGLAVIPLVFCVGYVGIIDSLDIVNIGPASRVVSERFNVSGPAASAKDTETASSRHHLFDIGSAGVMAASPLPFLAITVAVAGSLYPIPEGLVIGWAILGVVDARFDQSISDQLPNRERADLEGSAFDLVGNIVRSPKGIHTVVLTMMGFMGAAILVGVANSNVLLFAREGLAAIRSDPLYAWTVLGVEIVLLGSGLFAVWFWVRSIRRIPAYLQAWNTSNAEESSISDEALPEPTTRPIGMLLPFVLTVVPAMVLLQLLRFGYFFGLRTAVLAGYGVIWPLSILVLGWAVYRTRRTESQPPSSEGRALPVALLIQWAMFPLIYLSGAYVGEASGNRYPQTDLIEPLLVIIAIMMFVFIHPDLKARAKNAEGWRSYQASLAMFGAGLACAVGALTGGTTGLMLSIIATAFIVTSTWEVVTDELL